MPRNLHSLGDFKKAGQELIAVCDNIVCRHRWIVDLDKVMEHVGSLHPLIPVRDQKHFSERMLCPECGKRGAYIWPSDPKEPAPLFGTLSYLVGEWEGKGLVNAIARVSHLDVALAAFEAAVAAYPGRRLTLQQGSFLVRDSDLKVIEGGRARRPKR